MPPRKAYIKGWTPEQLAYMRWLCWPQSDKSPQYLNKTQFAALLGVNTTTLWQWQQMIGWNEAVQAMAQQVMTELTPEFYKSIAENMMSSKPSDKIIMTYFRYILPAIERNRDTWEARIQLKGEQTQAAEATRDALTAEIMELPEEMRDTLLAFWKRLLTDSAAGEAQLLPEAKNYDFTRQPEDPPKKRIKPEPEEIPPMPLPSVPRRLTMVPIKKLDKPDPE